MSAKQRQEYLDRVAITFAVQLTPPTIAPADFDPKEFEGGDFATPESNARLMDEAYARAALLWDARERQRTAT